MKAISHDQTDYLFSEEVWILDGRLTINLKMGFKFFNSPEYNYVFDMKNGMFKRWGKRPEDDPEYSEYGPEILDIEVSTVCGNNCPFCYKSNTEKGKNMRFKTFEKILDKFPRTLTQVAFGIGDFHANKDLCFMMTYCRLSGVIPNITINGRGMTDYDYNYLSMVCGAVAVSLYDKETCYNSVKELTDRVSDKTYLKQVNIHCLLSEETYVKCQEVLKDKMTDERLKNLNAIVFLWLKPKGERNTFTQLKSLTKLKLLVDFALDNGIPIGFDSCSASSFLKTVKGRENYKWIEQMIEPCESTLFSYYINVDGVGFPCSFSEGVKGYKGVSVGDCKDFLYDVWSNKETLKFRKSVIKKKDCNGCRQCPIYDLEVKK